MLPRTTTMRDDELDLRVRKAAFAFLDRERARSPDALHRDVLRAGFALDDARVQLIGPQGIFKPEILPRHPLSITTAPPKHGRPRPYDDQLDDDGLVRYRYRGVDPHFHENVRLREAGAIGLPLVYFHGVAPSWYVAAYPVFVVDDHPELLTFTVSIEDAADLSFAPPRIAGRVAEPERRYATRLAVHRLHQSGFRHRVLSAYGARCGVCRLARPALLDAAHIVPDTEPRGDPVVPNGIALCKLHHAAYDQRVLGIRPDLVIEVREDVLREVDGPMLRHGLQETHDTLLRVPRSHAARPDPDRLAWRYELFRGVG